MPYWKWTTVLRLLLCAAYLVSATARDGEYTVQIPFIHPDNGAPMSGVTVDFTIEFEGTSPTTGFPFPPLRQTRTSDANGIAEMNFGLPFGSSGVDYAKGDFEIDETCSFAHPGAAVQGSEGPGGFPRFVQFDPFETRKCGTWLRYRVVDLNGDGIGDVLVVFEVEVLSPAPAGGRLLSETIRVERLTDENGYAILSGTFPAPGVDWTVDITYSIDDPKYCPVHSGPTTVRSSGSNQESDEAVVPFCSEAPTRAPTVTTPRPTCDPDDSRHGSNCGGDPHFMRWTQARDTFHGECDLVLVHSDDFHDGAGFDLHVRTTIEKYYSYVETAAVRVGPHTLEVYKNHVYLNGMKHMIETAEPLLFESTDGKYQYEYVLVNETPLKRIFHLQLDSKSSIEFRFYKHFLTVNTIGHADDLADVVGLLGNYTDGSMWGRDGKPFHLSFEDYAFEWQFDPSQDRQMFLETREPQLPYESCRLPDMARPSRRNLRAGGDADLLARAQEACAMSMSGDVDLCVDDIMITGEIGLAEIW